MIAPDRLLTASLVAHPRGGELASIMAAALNAADPGAAVAANLAVEGDAVVVAGVRYASVRRAIVVGAGKAGAPMAAAAARIVGEQVSAGLVIVKDGHIGDATTGAIALREAAHPIPDARGVAGAADLARLLVGLDARDLVLALVSGGGSALLTLPAAGLTLEDLRGMTGALLACGASIGEINALRKHTTQLFGGQLARLAVPARVAALVISDVVGSPLDVIGSGPVSPDPSTYADALAVVERYGIGAAIPAVFAHLRRGAAGGLPETPKPDDRLWGSVQATVIASNAHAAEAAAAAGRRCGFATQLLTTYLEGEAREVGRVAASLARERALRGDGTPWLLIAGGETTVTLRGGGRGGRNQELALGAAGGLAGLRDVALIALATDGGDGPTDAAGAVATGETLGRALALGLDADAALASNDSYAFFDALGDLLRPGPTLTNVNDLLLIAGGGATT